MDSRANRPFGPAAADHTAPRLGRAATTPRLPLRSFRGGAADRPDSLDLVPPSLRLTPDGPRRDTSRSDAGVVLDRDTSRSNAGIVLDRDASRSDAGVVLDRELVALAAADARCRLVRARIAERVIATRCWRALGFVRLADFARERLGLSARSLEEDARVLHALAALPVLRAALEGGELSWTRTRLLVRSATPDSEGQLLDASRSVPMRELDDWVRAWDGGGHGRRNAASALDELSSCPSSGTSPPPAVVDVHDDARTDAPWRTIASSTSRIHDDARTDDPLLRRSLELSRTGNRLWRAACEYASRSAGSPLSPGQVLELVIAEAASSLPDAAVEEPDSRQPGSRRPAPPPEEFHERRLRAAIHAREARGRRAVLAFLAEHGAAEGFAWLDPASRDPGPARAMDSLLEGLEHAGAFELERRLQDLRVLVQRLESQMAALLRVGIDQRLFHELGFASVALYAEARLGICRRRVWNLVAIERHAWKTCRHLHDAWRDGHLTLLQATILLPVIDGTNGEAWIARAREVTLRRLQDEVTWALDHGDTPSSGDGLLPPPADADIRRDGPAGIGDDEVQKRAHGPASPDAPDASGSVCLDVFVPLSVAVLLETTLDRLQRTGEGRRQALERLIALALLEWRSAPKHRDPIFERDGWRCAVPGCSSRRNLQDHHVVFRSQGGGNARDNRITVCAGHHLHGIHAGIVRARGTAPGAIVWELGCRAGRPPLMRLLGDRLLHG